MKKYDTVLLKEIEAFAIKSLKTIAQKASSMSEDELDFAIINWFQEIPKMLSQKEKDYVKTLVNQDAKFGWLISTYPEIKKLFVKIGINKVKRSFIRLSLLNLK